MVIEELQPAHTQTRLCAVEVHLHSIVCDRDGPEHVVRIDVRVVVVNLFDEIGRSDWTGEQVKSNKGERALVTATVRADERALVEAHVDLKGQVLRFACFGVGSDSPAANAREAHEPVEVGDV